MLDDWTALLALPRGGMWQRIKAWTYFAVSPRMGTKRILKLKRTRGAQATDTFLAARSIGRVKALRTYATVNQEQATAALRMTVIANVSLPIGFVTVASQLSSGTIWNSLVTVHERNPDAAATMIVLGGLSLLALFWMLAYSATRVGQARDMRHLIDLHAAERGIYFGLEDEDALPSG